MTIYEILNVGQGDSIIIRPPQHCDLNGKTLIVDLGPGRYDVTKYIGEGEKVHIFLTHHDNDHVGGLRFFAGRMAQVSEITVPLYQNEITLIARAILNLKGISTSKDCGEFVRALEEIVNNQAFIKSLLEGRGNSPKLSFGYEKRSFCGHVKCLNPPILPEAYEWIRESSSDDLCSLMQEIFTPSFAKEMTLYIHASENGYYTADSPHFNEFWLWDRQSEELQVRKSNYVFGFIVQNTALFRQFNAEGSRKILRKIYNNYVKCTHDVCMVLKTDFHLYDRKNTNTSMLLTGDASKKVFNRLICAGIDLSASYLKMPHHGSKHNMNQKILEAIAPDTAIISHNNGHFGKARDPHPNREVLELLSRNHVKVLLTNDVIKDGVTVMEKGRHCKDYNVRIW